MQSLTQAWHPQQEGHPYPPPRDPNKKRPHPQPPTARLLLEWHPLLSPPPFPPTPHQSRETPRGRAQHRPVPTRYVAYHIPSSTENHLVFVIEDTHEYILREGVLEKKCFILGFFYEDESKVHRGAAMAS